LGEQNRGNVYNLLRKVASGKFLMVGNGKNVKSIMYVENVAAFIEYNLNNGSGEHPYNYVVLGKINIITSLAAKPMIGAIDGIHFLVADTSEEFCSKIVDIFSNPKKYIDIGKEAREFIKSKYTWDYYETKYISAIS